MKRVAYVAVALLCVCACGARSPLAGEMPAEDAGGVRERASVLLSAGRDHACVRDAERRVFCWGGDSLARGRTSGAGGVPNELVGLPRLVALSAGADTTCGVAEDGRVLCWGRRARSFVAPRNPMNASVTPVAVEGLSGGVDVAVGAGTICAGVRDGTARCWGENWGGGTLGIGTHDDPDGLQLPLGLAGVVSVAAGYESMGAVTASGALYVWGAWLYDEPRGRASQLTPVALPGFPRVRGASIGNGFVCAVTDAGEVWCQGYNPHGALGDGAMEHRTSPVRVAGLPPARAVSAGFEHACALGVDGSVWCWGDNRMGQTGEAASGAAVRPTRVALPTSELVALSAGWAYACAATADAQVYCWGEHGAGVGGDATPATRHIPRAVFAR